MVDEVQGLLQLVLLANLGLFLDISFEEVLFIVCRQRFPGINQKADL